MSNHVPGWMKVLFVLFLSISCGFVGLFLSRFFIPKSAGLAGGATVLFYGLIGVLVGLVLSLVLKNNLSKRTISFITGLVGALCIGGIAWLGLKIRSSNAESARQRAKSEEFYRTHKPTDQTAVHKKQSSNLPAAIGIGMASPNFANQQTLNLYNEENGRIPSTPVDSIAFSKSVHGDIKIASAPPHLVPAHLKLDYQIFYFKVIQEREDYYRIVVNEESGQTMWARKDAVNLKPWPEFLLQVFAVEPTNLDDNPIRKAPKTHASPINALPKDALLSPVSIESEWLEVKIMNDKFEEVDRGWIRWYDDKKIIVSYSLLS